MDFIPGKSGKRDATPVPWLSMTLSVNFFEDIGDMCLSLGTSDTIMMSMETAKPQIQGELKFRGFISFRSEHYPNRLFASKGYLMTSLTLDLGHVFVNPVNCDAYMGMLCYKNGSLARQAVRDHFRLSWDEFGRVLERTAPTNSIFINFPLTEITPFARGVWRFNITDGFLKKVNIFFHTIFSSLFKVDAFSREVEIRSLIESQMLAKKLHISKFGFNSTGKLIVTGGASKNRQIVQIIADVFDMEVFIQPETEVHWRSQNRNKNRHNYSYMRKCATAIIFPC